MRALLWMGLATLVGCGNTAGMLRDVRWGNEFDGDFEDVRERAAQVIAKHYPRGLDPDQSDPDSGDFYTVWHHEVSMWNRETNRSRARVVVEPRGEDRVRVGVAVVKQINNNIDNPHDIDDAIWVRKQRNTEMEEILESTIARRYLAAKPSETFEEKHRFRERAGLRKDIIDRSRDVDLGATTEPGDTMGDFDDIPSVTENERKRKKKKDG